MWLLLPAVLLVVLLPAVLRCAANAHGERVLLVPAEACCVRTDDIVVIANAAVIAMTAPRANVILFIFSQRVSIKRNSLEILENRSSNDVTTPASTYYRVTSYQLRTDIKRRSLQPPLNGDCFYVATEAMFTAKIKHLMSLLYSTDNGACKTSTSIDQ